MSTTDYANLDAVGLAKAIANKVLSSAEAVETAIHIAERLNPQLNAIVARTYDGARQSAAGPISGPFAGVPTFIKDTDDLRGVPTLMGSRAMPRKAALRSSAFVEQYLATGLLCLGKSAMPEFGLTATTEPLGFGVTRNPWNPEFSTGASSGGSAALVAAGVVPIAHANDGGGSIRIPASCCGLVGLKPSRSRLRDPDAVKQLPMNFIVQGAVTRTVRDTAAFMAAAEMVERNPRLPELGFVESPGKRRLRIAMFTTTADGEDSSEDCAQAVHHTARVLEELGHRVEAVDQPFDAKMADDFFVLWGLVPFALHHLGRVVIDRDFDRNNLDDWTLGLASIFRRNILRFPAVLRRLRRFEREYEQNFHSFDLMLSPTLAHAPPPIGYLGPDVPFDTAIERVRRFASFTPTQNVAGTPAISLPLGRSSDGLPIGVQLAAPMGEDRRLLEVAYELEEAMPWRELRPQLYAAG
ncbi:MAG: amidase [Hyphomicrobiaceae bacterium]|jgi:amidase